MTAHVLNTELTSLLQESKRKNPELRSAAERSLQDLKSLSVTSESQLAADLLRRPHFVSPFLIACQSKNAKLANSGAGGLQRLAVAIALPKERLKEVVEALKDCSSSGFDVQLKVLQTLPALSQNYSSEIRGDLLFGLLQICSTLQASKQYAVSNSAAATLQQLIITLFENLEFEDTKALEIPVVTSIEAERVKIQLRPVAYDAFRTFNDLCLLTEGSKPHHIKLTSLPQSSGLELIESILSNHASAFNDHPEQGHILRTILLPFIIRALSERQSFPVTVRVMRVLSVIVRRHLSVAPAECEMALGLLNHMLDPDAASPWKRALSLEVFRQVYGDIGLIFQICSMFDEVEGKKNILRDNLTLFVRLASEKPTLIGLGHQSSTTVARNSVEEVSGVASMIDNSGVAGLIEAASRETSTGISTLWSSIRVSCIDQLDKAEAPQLPETYIYSLVLMCINNLADCLARFVLPLTVHKESRGRKRTDTHSSADQEHEIKETTDPSAKVMSLRKRAVPINPLTLERHKSIQSIKMVASMIDDSWPAIMACCSTFLYATLDNDFYRALVRSFQKFTQVAGLLRMRTPRDAFLTTLGKAAVPSHVVATSMSPQTPAADTSGLFQNAKGLLTADPRTGVSGAQETQRRTPADQVNHSLSGRNLLCLRALLNVAIALGPTLEDAWRIPCETLQQAEIIMSTSATRFSTRDSGVSNATADYSEDSSPHSIANEVAAVQAAATRMFESTIDYPNEAFSQLLTALCRMLQNEERKVKGSEGREIDPSPTGQPRRGGSVSITSINTDSRVQTHVLALQKIGEVVSLNMDRFEESDDAANGWNILLDQLCCFACDSSVDSRPRRLAADILSRLTLDSIQAQPEDAANSPSSTQKRALVALATCISALGININNLQAAQARDTNLDVHLIWLHTLRSIIERNGDSISDGWDTVFKIVLSAFQPLDIATMKLPEDYTSKDEKVFDLHFKSNKLGQAAFDVMQLICSDFLGSVPEAFLQTLVDLPFRFCVQLDDLNISLTMTAVFWQLSDFLKQDLSSTDISIRLSETSDNVDNRAKAWIYLLRRLIIITADLRSEVRNTAIHTLFRIFSSCDLNSSAWTACLRNIFLSAIDSNVFQQNHLSTQDHETESRSSWNETSELLMTGFADLLADKIEVLLPSEDWSRLWEAVSERFGSYLQLLQRFLHGVIYSSLLKIFSRVIPPIRMKSEDLDVTLQLWLSYPPSSAQTTKGDQADKSFEVYAQCFKEIYKRFHVRMLVGVLERSSENLLSSIRAAQGDKYGTDLDAMTQLQSDTISCLEDIHTHCLAAQPLIITTLSQAFTLPLSAPHANTISNATFVAFSKASMNLMILVMQRKTLEADDNLGSATTAALRSLSELIELKYDWARQGRDPSLWQHATSSALVAIETVLPASKSMNPDVQQELWLAAVSASHFIASANCAARTEIDSVLADEQSDIEALGKLRRVIVPALGISKLSDSIRRIHTFNLFQTSLIHSTELEKNLFSLEEPLNELYDVRLGRTTKSLPRLRTEMAYFCFSELIALTTARSDSSSPDADQQYVHLARAAAPFMILRAALPIKSYIADQPLRGRMPQPFSQRQELLFVLRQMRQLNSDSRAIPQVEGAITEHKRHLVRLLPLINKALGVAGSRKGLARDDEVMEEMLGWQADVSSQFGL